MRPKPKINIPAGEVGKLTNLAWGKVNLASKWRKLEEKCFELNIAPKTKNQYSCRRGWDCLNLACGKVNLASRRKKLWWNVILSNILVQGKKFIRYLYVHKKNCKKKHNKNHAIIKPEKKQKVFDEWNQSWGPYIIKPR